MRCPRTSKVTNTKNRMKISARNRPKGKFVEVIKGATTAHVRIDVGGSIVTAAITNEFVDELGLKFGGEADLSSRPSRSSLDHAFWQ